MINNIETVAGYAKRLNLSRCDLMKVISVSRPTTYAWEKSDSIVYGGVIYLHNNKVLSDDMPATLSPLPITQYASFYNFTQQVIAGNVGAQKAQFTSWARQQVIIMGRKMYAKKRVINSKRLNNIIKTNKARSK